MFGHDASPYIDRILRSEKPGDLPVQYPAKFILTVTLATAKARGPGFPSHSFFAQTS
jgi:putative ABC transport system substrate-binding protein